MPWGNVGAQGWGERVTMASRCAISALLSRIALFPSHRTPSALLTSHSPCLLLLCLPPQAAGCGRVQVAAGGAHQLCERAH